VENSPPDERLDTRPSSESKVSSPTTRTRFPDWVKMPFRFVWSLPIRLWRRVYLKRNENLPLTWEEYKVHVDLYKTYLDVTVRAIIFFYAIAGTILTLIYSSDKLQGEDPSRANVQKLFLLTPFVVSVLMAVSFVVGGLLWGALTNNLNRKLEDQAHKLEEQAHMKDAPENVCRMFDPPFTHVLTVVLLAFGLIFGLVAWMLWDIMVALNILSGVKSQP
jgi:hypothetical protein